MLLNCSHFRLLNLFVLFFNILENRQLLGRRVHITTDALKHNNISEEIRNVLKVNLDTIVLNDQPAVDLKSVGSSDLLYLNYAWIDLKHWITAKSLLAANHRKAALELFHAHVVYYGQTASNTTKNTYVLGLRFERTTEHLNCNGSSTVDNWLKTAIQNGRDMIEVSIPVKEDQISISEESLIAAGKMLEHKPMKC